MATYGFLRDGIAQAAELKINNSGTIYTIVDDNRDLMSIRNAEIDGNLTVKGTTVTVSASNLVVQDKHIELNHDPSGTRASNVNAGLIISGSSQYRDVKLEVVADGSKFKAYGLTPGFDINTASGSSPGYSIGGTSVLNATTLGANVVASSLTSVGTISSLVATTADINAGTVDAVIGGTTPAAGTFTAISGTTVKGTVGTLTSLALQSGGITAAGTIAGATGITSTGTATFATVTGSGTATFNAMTSDTVDINGGAIDGAVIGANEVAAGSFAAVVGTTATFSAALSGTTVGGLAGTLSSLNLQSGGITNAGTIAGATGVTSTGTATFATVTGSGTATFNAMTSDTVDINGGAIDGAVIGANSVAAGSFAAVVGTTATFSSKLDAGGDIDLGNNWDDEIKFEGSVVSHVVPLNTTTYNLGSGAAMWDKLYVSEIEGSSSADDVSFTSILSASQASRFVGAASFDSTITATGTITGSNITSTFITGSRVSADFFTGDGAALTNISSDSVDVADSSANSEFRLVGVAASGDGVTLTAMDTAADLITMNASTGKLTLAGPGIAIGSADITEAEFEFLDGATAGTAVASKAVVLDASKNIATIGTLGCGAITSTGTSTFATVTGSGTATFGAMTSDTVDINGGAIDGAVIGANEVAAGSFAAVVGTTATFSAAISGTTVGGTVGTLTSLALQSGGITAAGTIAGATGITSTGTATFATVTGSGTATFGAMTSDTVDINGGAIDGTVIGANAVAAGTFAAVKGTTLSGSSTLQVGGATTVAGNITPLQDVAYDLGSTAKRWANVYTGDLHLKNERGDWTLYEEATDIMVRNNLSGKMFKLGLVPVEEDEV